MGGMHNNVLCQMTCTVEVKVQFTTMLSQIDIDIDKQ